MKGTPNRQSQKRIEGISRETGASIPLIEGSRVLHLTSEECHWQFAQIEVNATGPYENPPLISINPTIGMCLADDPIRCEFDLNGRVQRSVFVNKDVTIIPQGDVGRWRSFDPHQTLMISIKNSLLCDIAVDCRLPGNVQLPFAAPIPNDPFMQATIQALHDEAISGFRSGQLYGDSLITALAAHLLCRYGVSERRLEEPRGGLSTEALQSTIEWLKENYNRDVSLEDLSALAHLSPFHFCRLFKRSTGMSPHRYLIHCRVKRVREMLLNPANSQINLKQLAKEVGFCDAGHLNRHFKRTYGISPSQLLNHLP